MPEMGKTRGERMNRYADVEKVQRLIVETGNRHSRNGEDIHTCSSICTDLIIGVHKLSTADVQEVQHGCWVNLKISVSGSSSAECSLCGAVVHESFTNGKAIHYCPNCGAKMGER